MNSESDKNDSLPPVEIPAASIAAELLEEIIHSFIAREGTDYGDVEATLEKKVSDIRRQLERGEIKLMFDPNDESVTFVPRR